MEKATASPKTPEEAKQAEEAKERRWGFSYSVEFAEVGDAQAVIRAWWVITLRERRLPG